VRTSVIGAKTRDFAWFSSAQALQKETLAVIPGNGQAALHLANAGDADRSLSIAPLSGGAPIALKVPAEGGAHVKLPAGSYRITGADDLRGSVSLSDDGQTSSFALAPPGPLAAPITVYPN
jgi:hypothetical protein